MPIGSPVAQLGEGFHLALGPATSDDLRRPPCTRRRRLAHRHPLPARPGVLWRDRYRRRLAQCAPTHGRAGRDEVSGVQTAERCQHRQVGRQADPSAATGAPRTARRGAARPGRSPIWWPRADRPTNADHRARRGATVPRRGAGGRPGSAAAPGSRCLLVTATGREAEVATAAIGDLIGDDHVDDLPVLGNPAARTALTARRHRRAPRLPTLRRLAHPESTRPAARGHRHHHPVADPADGARPRRADAGPAGASATRSTSATSSERLVELAYHRVEMVERRGEIAVRGGILDIFPPTADHPVRVEFFGDEITDMRTFAVTDQRSIDPVAELVAPPPAARSCSPRRSGHRAAELSAAGTGDPTLAEMLGKLAAGIAGRGHGGADPGALPGRLVLLPELLPAGTHRRAGRPGTDPDPGRRPGPHRAGVPGRVLDGGRDGRPGADRPGRVGLPPAGRNTRQASMDLESAAVADRAVRRRRPGSPIPAAARRARTSPAGRSAAPRPTAARSRPPSTDARPSGRRTVAPPSWWWPGPAPRRAPPSRWPSRASARVERRRRRSPKHPGRRSSPSPAAGSRTASSSPAQNLAVITEADLTGNRGGAPEHRDQAAGPAAQRRRPAGAQARRLRGARPARHRQVRRHGPARTAGGADPRVPGRRVRAEQARPPRRPAVRADRLARPAVPLRRRRGARR